MNPKMEIERLSELVARLEKDLNCKGNAHNKAGSVIKVCIV